MNDTKKASEENRQRIKAAFANACAAIQKVIAVFQKAVEAIRRIPGYIALIATDAAPDSKASEAEELKALREACRYRPIGLNLDHPPKSFEVCERDWIRRNQFGFPEELRKKEDHGEQQIPPGLPGQTRDWSDPETREPEAPRSLSSGF